MQRTLPPDQLPRPRFAIISLPRSGSTTVANLLNLHPDVRCLIEPFHPGRYGGQFNRFAQTLSVAATVREIWTQWTGIKHVFDSAGFPFLGNPALNDDVARVDGQAVVVLLRGNQLRRLISHHLCRYTKYWIGSASTFRAVLKHTRIPPLDIEAARAELRRDGLEVERRLSMLERERIPHLVIRYEELFTRDLERQHEVVTGMLAFLGLRRPAPEVFLKQWAPVLNIDSNRWSSPDVYRHIPDVGRLERELGSDETGWLFRD